MQPKKQQEVTAQPKARKGLTGLVVLAICLGVVVVILGAALVINSQSTLYSFAAQEDTEQEESTSQTPTVTNPTTQITNLVSLIGKSQSDAINTIGHGADVQDQESLSSLGFSKEVVVVLTDEKGDRYSGTPTVTLGLDANGNVAAASYEASTLLLGYGDLAFAPAVKDFYIVEFMLRSVGLTNVENGIVTLPDSSEYSTYESDQKTLSRENYSFIGQTVVGDQTYSWEVTLDYDYSEANKASDLADTIKRVSVAIMKA